MRGRPRKPTPLKILHGDAEKNPSSINRREPKPPNKKPRCPQHLDKIARAKWREVAKILSAMGILSEAERTLLEMYCVTYSNWRQSQKMFLEDDGGGLKPNPSYHKYIADLHRLNSELGLSYVSRSKIDVGPKEEPSTKEAKYFG